MRAAAGAAQPWDITLGSFLTTLVSAVLAVVGNTGQREAEMNTLSGMGLTDCAAAFYGGDPVAGHGAQGRCLYLLYRGARGGIGLCIRTLPHVAAMMVAARIF